MFKKKTEPDAEATFRRELDNPPPPARKEREKTTSACVDTDCAVAVVHDAHIGTPAPSSAIRELTSEDIVMSTAKSGLMSAKTALDGIGHFETNQACAKIDEALALLQACEASDVP